VTVVGGVPERMDYIQELLARTENPAESSPERLSKEDPQTAEEQEQLRERMSAMVDQVAAASSSAIGDEQKMLSVLYGVYGKDKTTMSPEEIDEFERNAKGLIKECADEICEEQAT